MADDRHREAVDIVARVAIVNLIYGHPPLTFMHARDVAERIGGLIDELTPTDDEIDGASAYLTQCNHGDGAA